MLVLSKCGVVYCFDVIHWIQVLWSSVLDCSDASVQVERSGV